MPHQPQPNLPPPVSSTGVLGWLRKNLFSSPLNTVLTLLSVYFLYQVIPPLIQWMLIDATWAGETRESCVSDGACWVFVRAHFAQFIYGFYPESGHWRVNATFLLLIILLIPLFFKSFPYKIWLGVTIIFIHPVIAYYLLHGGIFGLEIVETALWGGLMLTLILAWRVLSLPMGILLALGRRSKMPVIRALCIAYIELWRGVPLITVLFMSSVMLPLFLPEGVNFDKLLRALIGITIFESAYMAEVVRGGLQAIPKGQYEAAESLGLSYWKTMGLVVLPQALKLVIPGLVNTFIALFKDTTLVLIIGLFDLLAIIESAFRDPHWLGYAVEGYVFAALVFWSFCFGLSRYSQSLERKFAVDKE